MKAIAKKTNKEPISGLSLVEALSSPPRLSIEKSGKKAHLTYEIFGEKVQLTYETLKEGPRLSYEVCREQAQQSYEEIAAGVLLKDILIEIAPSPFKPKYTIHKLPEKSFQILDNEKIFASVALALNKKVEQATKIKKTVNNLRKTLYSCSYLDVLIFVFCRMTGNLNHPVVKARLNRAIKYDDTEYFVTLGKELKYGISRFTPIESIMIFGWSMSIHPRVPPLCQFTDDALWEFFNASVPDTSVDEDYTFDMIRKTRQRLRLLQSNKGRVTVEAGKLIFP